MGLVVEDFVDGVMINMFYYGGAWRLATRTVLNATGSFYGTRPFGELFWETFKAEGLNLGLLSTEHTYSWVLQHPEERVVVATKYGIPHLSLVESSLEAEQLPAELLALKPKCHADLKTLEDVKERVVAWGKRFGAGWQGLVIHMANKQRYKLRSDEYDEARHLRGNQANRRYIWLERWSQGRLPAYLRLFPEEQHDAEAIVAAFKEATQDAHTCFIDVYRNHKYPLGQAPQKYRKLLWDAKTVGKGVYYPHFREFMNGLDTARKLWVVNWERRFGAAAPVAWAGTTA